MYNGTSVTAVYCMLFVVPSTIYVVCVYKKNFEKNSGKKNVTRTTDKY